MTLLVCLRAAASAHGATPGTPPIPIPGQAPRRIALYDPESRAATSLHALGLLPQIVRKPEDLMLFEGDLIVVGPGGFGRGQESLGPVLAARLRAGMPVLLLDQSSLPATLHDDLRLWPSFAGGAGGAFLVASRHPVMRGLSEAEATAYFAGSFTRVRPLLPPTRGNFRVLAEARARNGAAWQEGVSMLEMRVGDGTLLAAQASLCTDSASDPRARLLLRNAVDYLSAAGRPRPRAALLGAGTDSLPVCLQRLSLFLPPAPVDLAGVDLLVAPADWRALRMSSGPERPPRARVARFLHEGGTLILLNPQSLVLEPLAGLTGAVVSFAAAAPPTGAGDDPRSDDLLQGIAPEDLRLLAQPGRPELVVRSSAGDRADVEMLQIEPGFARYRVGRGTLVAIMIPDASQCDAAPVASLLARLLTNLGVPLDADSGRDGRAITRLDDTTD